MNDTLNCMPPLAEYIDLIEVQRKLPHFPTIDSFRWFVRRHRDELANRGALILIAGRQKFNLSLTEAVILEAGRRAALGGVES